MTTLTADANRVIDYLVSAPVYGKTTTTKEVVRSILLGTDGWLMVAGHMWDVKSKHRGAGIYEVWLERRA